MLKNWINRIKKGKTVDGKSVRVDGSEPVSLPTPSAIGHVADDMSTKGTDSSVLEESSVSVESTTSDAAPIGHLLPPEQQVEDSTENTVESGTTAVFKPKKLDLLLAKLKSKSYAKKESSTSASFEVPIRMIIGFLPDVSERDALEYSVGLAYKHFEQISLAFYDVYKYQNGYIYELHEGGSGRAFTPEIIKYFNSRGPVDNAVPVSVVLPTATRLLQIQRSHDGLICVLLPENSTLAVSEDIKPHEKMRPAINKNTGLLVAGGIMFVSGFLAMMVTGLIIRDHPVDVAKEAKRSISYNDSPLAKYLDLKSRNETVEKIEFINGLWQPLIPISVPAVAPAPASATTSTPPALPPSASNPDNMPGSNNTSSGAK